jgi:molecular chaperone DnaJ/curved DNA-binding protein
MPLDFKDYYRILGVDKSADESAIKRAYRRLARKYHPDLNKSKGSAERFKEINEAHEVLSDPEKRRRYDALGPDWQKYAQAGSGRGTGPFPGGFRVEYQGNLGDVGGFSEFFRTIFGDLGGGRRGGPSDVFDEVRARAGGSGAAARGQDVQAALEISLEEAFHGTRRAFSFELDEPCVSCAGAGHTEGRPCPTCGGRGWQQVRRDLDVKIPAGVKTGSRVRVAGEGGGGTRGAGRGDLYLTVSVASHPLFARHGDDIHVEIPVTAPEAALGASIDVPTLRGKVSMRIPAGTGSGRTFRLRGYGMPRLKGGGAGDQLVRIKVVVPADLTPRERDLYGELARLRTDNPRAYLG